MTRVNLGGRGDGASAPGRSPDSDYEAAARELGEALGQRFGRPVNAQAMNAVGKAGVEARMVPGPDSLMDSLDEVLHPDYFWVRLLEVAPGHFAVSMAIGPGLARDGAKHEAINAVQEVAERHGWNISSMEMNRPMGDVEPF